jgi:uncharacterized protein (DUF1697 family)
MALSVALLRAVNVAGHGKVAMADLRAVAGDLGYGAVGTVLQTGNLVFDGGRAAAARLEAELERAVAGRLGFTTDIMVRRGPDWLKLVADNPFPEIAGRDPGHLVVLVLKTAVDGGAVEALGKAVRGREVVAGGGDRLYVHYRDGIGRSKLTNAAIEKVLGTRTTGRNWNTVLKIAAAMAG